MKATVNGEPVDTAPYQSQVRAAGAESVRKQGECGIDIVTDGEQSKTGFFAIRARTAEWF
jgi:5-methyltetrahydropteroyltriglutamate--homocysteine methyltransferase